MKKRTNMIRLVACLALLLSSATLVVAQQAAVKIFAHRGGKLEYDENTMQAFRQVYEKGLRGYEIDIRITKDNHLVVFHDADFKRVLGIEGSVETSTLNEIKALRTKKGNPIPTADEVIEFFNSKSGLYVEFEMKTKSPLYEPELLERYCDMLYQKVYANMPEGSEYLMTSFDTRPLKYLGDKYPQVEMLLIRGEGLSENVLEEAKKLGITRLGCSVHGTNKKMVDKAKKEGFTVSLWPGHSVEDFLLGVALGSDYLCTDVPVAVTDWVNEHGSWITLK
ncbi:MAG: glycerophosphodiester phosphodiesterase [Sphingobacterium sp.]|uniref:glycerophosphodiester phosphodiesterase n=1 Tax=Sphingobacterium sp. JB170 TaxID=1434842 RepID=UPI00097F5487|nr:glycerophosphodiester phosphodiesterase [Sphingobacterium sp. JB170]SJN47349.1 Glycerophosphoryl diester phosphodiesterase [Sphingobacterium sp. JB170]